MNRNRILALLVALSLPMAASARITGGNNDGDIACWGPSGAEACIDSAGSVIPTTTNDADLGTSSLVFRAIHVTAGGLTNGSVVNADLTDLTIESGKLKAGSIDSEKLATGSVDTDAIATDAVASGEILNATIANVDIANLTIQSGKLASNSVDSEKLAASSVDTDKLQTGSVNTSKLLGGGTMVQSGKIVCIMNGGKFGTCGSQVVIGTGGCDCQ